MEVESCRIGTVVEQNLFASGYLAGDSDVNDSRRFPLGDRPACSFLKNSAVYFERACVAREVPGEKLLAVVILEAGDGAHEASGTGELCLERRKTDLNELQVHQFSPGAVGERITIACHSIRIDVDSEG